MTTVNTIIGEDDVSGDILELDIWAKDMAVGRWRVLLKNLADKWGGDFHTNDPVTLTINTVDMMKGYLDDAKNGLSDKGVYTNEIEVIGRDYGRDLARLYYTAKYSETEADDVIRDLLLQTGSEITGPNLATTPIVNIDRSRTFLIDWAGALGKRVDYSAYVDMVKLFHFFALGAVAEESGVALASIADELDNNILHLLKGEEIGVSVANKVELTAGELKDHYTDGNGKASAVIGGAYTSCDIDVDNGFDRGVLTANGGTPFSIFSVGEQIVISNSENGNDGRYTIHSVGSTVLITTTVIAGTDNDDDTQIIVSPWGNWIPGQKCNVINEIDPLLRMRGISSIKFFNTVAAKPQISLDFSYGLYSHSALDLSEPDEMSFYIRHDNSGEKVIIQPQLEDGDGKVIEFYRFGGWPAGGSSTIQKGITEDVPVNKWHKIQINVGDNIVLANDVKTDSWYNIVGDGFDWFNVVKITIRAVRHAKGVPVGVNLSATNLYLDSLCIRAVEVIALIQDAVSIAAHGPSQWWDQRNDIKSVIELEVIAAKELANRKDPLRTIRVIASGQTGSKYAGQSLTVQAPGHGIATATKYRIISLHHQVRKKSIKKGYNFITTYDLIKHAINPTQVVDPLRFELATDPRGAALEILNLTRRRIKSSRITERQGFGDTHPVITAIFLGSGTAFPEYPADNFAFNLTADIEGTHLAGSYRYNEATTSWIRFPLRFHRAINPTFGQLVGDLNENTTDLMIYRWTGSEWLRVTIKHTEGTTLPTVGMINGDTFYHTTLKRTYTYNGVSWEFTGTPDHGATDGLEDDDHLQYHNDERHAAIEHPTDQLAIEMRPWTGNFSVIWDDKDDDPPTDWNHFRWGKRDNEGPPDPGLDATISYATDPPTTVDVNCGQDENVVDGEWFLYWDENEMSGDPLKYDVQWTQDYSLASGKGKGLLAVVQVRNGDGIPPPEGTAESPSVLPWNTYIPQMGVGSLVAHSLYSKHFSGDWITGKNYRTAIDVGEVGGPGGIRFDKDYFRGYSSGTQRTFELESGTGLIKVFGSGSFRAYTADGTLMGFLGASTLDYLELFSNGGHGMKIHAGGSAIYIEDDSFILIEAGPDSGVHLRPRGIGKLNVYKDIIIHHTAGILPDIGEAGRPFEAAHINKIHSYEKLVIPLIEGDPPSPVDGEMWIDTTV